MGGGVKIVLVALVLWVASNADSRAANPAAINIVGDGIVAPLTTTPGDVVRGAAIVANRQIGLCVLCHPLPAGSNANNINRADEKFQSNIATSIAGTGSRWSAAQLRLRLVDSRRLDPAGIMPAYYRVEGLTRVAATQQGRPIFDAQQIEDVVAYLVTLK